MTQPDGTLRAFIALAIPMSAKSLLEEVVEPLVVQTRDQVRWVNIEGIHLTLKFLGNVDAARIEPVAEAMCQVSLGTSPFRLALSGMGMFPNEKRPRVIWARVQGDLDSLGELQARIEDQVSSQGFSREKRAFSPHLTLRRVRDNTASDARRQIGAAVTACSMGPTESWQVDSVRLVRSHLTPGGATYTDLAVASLGGNGEP